MPLTLVVICFLIVPAGAWAQAAPASAPVPVAAPDVFTLDQAIQYAVEHYPTVRAALEQVHASTAGVSVARAGYLPRLDSVWQTNRATANNIFGQVLPQSVIPAMSGPVLPFASGDSVWGSAAGALFVWEPFDFGLRGATVAGAEAAVTRARAGESLTRLEVQSAVGASFLGVVAAQRAVVAMQADVERRGVLARIVHALVDSQLRPGAEGSRIDAERAAATTRLIRAQATLTLAQSALARVLGLKTGQVAIDAASLLEQIPAPVSTEPVAGSHPLALVHQAAVDVAKAQEEVLARTDRPRLYVQSSVFARGSGANPNGQFDGGVSGLGLDRANWAAGVQIVFPNLFDFTSLRARKAGVAASERAEAALYDEAMLTITSQQQAAAAMVLAARAVAANTPVQLAAARQSEAQARARYPPELAAQRAESQSKLQGAEAQLAAVRSKADADASVYDKLKAASATPGVVADNDLVLAQKAAEADQGHVAAAQQNIEAARQALKSMTDMESYLRVIAPFDGVVTERNVHPGALVGPASGAGVSTPMVRLVERDRLRLVVPVPEAYTAGVTPGAEMPFSVAAYPGQSFLGKVARIAQSVDVSTRTMAVGLDVMNKDGRLTPGAFCQVRWPVRRTVSSLLVPSDSVAGTTGRSFVVRIRSGRTEWVDVKTGVASGPLVEVFGELRPGDEIAARGTDEIRAGTDVRVRPARPTTS